MDKDTTHIIKLIGNGMVIIFSRDHSPDPLTLGSQRIRVSQYRMEANGVYFVYDHPFYIDGSYVNDSHKKQLFFVPFEYITAIEMEIEKDESEEQKDNEEKEDLNTGNNVPPHEASIG